MNETIAAPRKFLSETEAATYLGLTRRQLIQKRSKPEGLMPRYYDHGVAVRYALEDLDEYLARCVRGGDLPALAAHAASEASQEPADELFAEEAPEESQPLAAASL